MSKLERFIAFLLTLVLLSIAAVVLALVLQKHMPTVGAPETEVLTLATAAPAAIASEAPEEGEVPEATPVPTAAPRKKIDYDYLPVYNRAETPYHRIAITIDGCEDEKMLAEICTFCYDKKIDLTLFPYGKTIMKGNMSGLIAQCVEAGFEIENRTWSNGSLYKLSPNELANEIWTTDIAVDYALSLDYGMHLIRMRGGYGSNDTRTHDYLKMLGYDGIVTWTCAAADSTLEAMREQIAPGNIYLFECNEAGFEKLKGFTEYASDAGYEMVTLNRLLGYPDNTMTEGGDVLNQTMPVMNYTPLYAEYHKGDRAWQIYLIQTRLAELGYLASDSPDGIYGTTTATALSIFQTNCGMLGTGVATYETQERLFAEDAPKGDIEQITSKATPIPAG